MDIFTALANALTALIGGTPSTSCIANQDCGAAGFILGIVVIVAVLIAVTWALGEHIKGPAVLIPMGTSYLFVVLVGWWPLWSVIFIAIIVVIGGVVYGRAGASTGGI